MVLQAELVATRELAAEKAAAAVTAAAITAAAVTAAASRLREAALAAAANLRRGGAEVSAVETHAALLAQAPILTQQSTYPSSRQR